MDCSVRYCDDTDVADLAIGERKALNVHWTEKEKGINADSIKIFGEHYAERLFLFAKNMRGKMKVGHQIAVTHEAGCPWEKSHCHCNVKFEYCGQVQ